MSLPPVRKAIGLSRGEQWLLVSIALVVAGSSPRLRWVEAATGGAEPPSKDRTAASSAAHSPPPSCSVGHMADDRVCVSLPDPALSQDVAGAPESEVRLGAHVDRHGHYRMYDQIPRRPDRPAGYDRYVYPIPPGLPNGQSVVSGYDLDQPDEQQRRGRMRAVGHGGVDLPQKRGTPVQMIRLEHQIGDARVIHTGPLMGLSVVTLHVLREGGRDRSYVLIFGHLDGFPREIRPGAIVRERETVGFVGDTGSPELVHLHLEARRLRDDIDGTTLPSHRILANDVSVVCDPRNVLPLRPDALPSGPPPAH